MIDGGSTSAHFGSVFTQYLGSNTHDFVQVPSSVYGALCHHHDGQPVDHQGVVSHGVVGHGVVGHGVVGHGVVGHGVVGHGVVSHVVELHMYLMIQLVEQ